MEVSCDTRSWAVAVSSPFLFHSKESAMPVSMHGRQ